MIFEINQSSSDNTLIIRIYSKRKLAVKDYEGGLKKDERKIDISKKYCYICMDGKSLNMFKRTIERKR